MKTLFPSRLRRPLHNSVPICVVRDPSPRAMNRPLFQEEKNRACRPSHLLPNPASTLIMIHAGLLSSLQPREELIGWPLPDRLTTADAQGHATVPLALTGHY